MFSTAAAALAAALAASPGPAHDALRDADGWSAEAPFTTRSYTGAWTETFETDRGFAKGNLPQQGWTAAYNPAAIINDGLFILEGELSLRHMADSSGFTEFALRSPVFEHQYGRLSATMLRGSPNSKVQFITVDASLNSFNTRVSFEIDGRITVGQLNETKDAFDFIDTGRTWDIFEAYEIGVETDPFGALRVYLDDDLIFEGVEATYALKGKAGRIGEWRMWTDNQTTGRPDGRGDTTTWDAFRFDPAPPVPAPGALSLLAIGGLCAARRRR
jgi:MYXO-CTERM domain-containing protein